MRSFFKTFFAAFLALVVFTIVGIFTIVGSVMVAAESEMPTVGDNAVLVIDLGDEFKEVREEDPLNFLEPDPASVVPSLYETVRLIAHAKEDDQIKGIFIKCGSNNNGMASSEELRKALEDFKQTKKFIIAYGEAIPQNAYYIASIADKVYAHPQAGLEWFGFASKIVFLKGMLDKLEIEPQVFYAGKFKSATEPFRATQMTPENKLQTSVYINDLYSKLISAVAKSRKLDTAVLRAIAVEGKVRTAADAVTYKLLDGVKYDDEVKAVISKELDISKNKDINFVYPGEYISSVNLDKGDAAKKVAVVYANGDIVDGDGETGMIASNDYRKFLRDIRLDKKIKAVVLRINSPGGSALASDVIWRELELLKKEKPLVVSMGNYAASGGYYIACNADSVFANENTITGSIGVFGLLPNMQRFFNNKLGVTFDGVATGPYADMGSLTRPLSAGERSFFQSSIDTIYATFKGKVAAGRKRNVEYIDSIAQGRVWTGKRALGIGLVDKLGTLQDAVVCAARMAKLSEYKIAEYPEPEDVFEQFANSYKRNTKAAALKSIMTSDEIRIYEYMQKIKLLSGTPQARLPFEILH